MSFQKPFRISLIAAFSLSIASIASARRPPAVVELQRDADRVIATCPQSGAALSAGYRDMLARVESARVEQRALAPIPPPRKMGDHLVLVCAGGEIHQGSGYRGFPSRLLVETAADQIARIPLSVKGRDL